MMTSRTLQIVALVALLVSGGGCAVSLSSQAKKQRIEVATHPEMVKGLEFVTGYMTETIPMAGATSAANKAANKAASDGYSDVVVFLELVGQVPGLSTWRVSIYRKAVTE